MMSLRICLFFSICYLHFPLDGFILRLSVLKGREVAIGIPGITLSQLSCSKSRRALFIPESPRVNSHCPRLGHRHIPEQMTMIQIGLEDGVSSIWTAWTEVVFQRHIWSPATKEGKLNDEQIKHHRSHTTSLHRWGTQDSEKKGFWVPHQISNNLKTSVLPPLLPSHCLGQGFL